MGQGHTSFQQITQQLTDRFGAQAVDNLLGTLSAILREVLRIANGGAELNWGNHRVSSKVKYRFTRDEGKEENESSPEA